MQSDAPCTQDRSVTGYFSLFFTTLEPDSPDSGDTYPVVASTCRLAIHRLANANKVMTCAPFLASPR